MGRHRCFLLWCWGDCKNPWAINMTLIHAVSVAWCRTLGCWSEHFTRGSGHLCSLWICQLVFSAASQGNSCCGTKGRAKSWWWCTQPGHINTWKDLIATLPYAAHGFSFPSSIFPWSYAPEQFQLRTWALMQIYCFHLCKGQHDSNCVFQRICARRYLLIPTSHAAKPLHPPLKR